VRELVSSLQQFGEFLLKAQLVRPTAAPYFVRWVRRFLSRAASGEPLADQVRGFSKSWRGTVPSSTGRCVRQIRRSASTS
jgi:hypothetical protein